MDTVIAVLQGAFNISVLVWMWSVDKELRRRK